LRVVPTGNLPQKEFTQPDAPKLDFVFTIYSPDLVATEQEGAYVFITGRRQKELDEAVEAIGSNITGVQGDIAKLTDLDRLYEIVATERRIDVVFANAGVAEFAPLGKITEEHFDKLFDINVKETLFTVQKALPLLNDGGSIILNGSVASVKGTPASGIYGATKAALRSFVRTWTSDLKDRHVRSNVISPGGRPIRQLSRDSLQTPLHESCPRSQWDGWGIPTKLPKRRCFWRRTTPVSSQVSNCSLMAAEGSSDRDLTERDCGLHGFTTVERNRAGCRKLVPGSRPV
jgi:NAD(P)-dependent dehydrogenase (short-subunit alcohol dehydrogenase family)